MSNYTELPVIGNHEILPLVGGPTTDILSDEVVENVLLQADNIREATVFGVKHPLMGQAVQARVSLHEPEDSEALTERLRRFCLDRLARYKMPTRFLIVNEAEQRNERFKKVRQSEGGGPGPEGKA